MLQISTELTGHHRHRLFSIRQRPVHRLSVPLGNQIPGPEVHGVPLELAKLPRKVQAHARVRMPLNKQIWRSNSQGVRASGCSPKTQILRTGCLISKQNSTTTSLWSLSGFKSWWTSVRNSISLSRSWSSIRTRTSWWSKSHRRRINLNKWLWISKAWMICIRSS